MSDLKKNKKSLDLQKPQKSKKMVYSKTESDENLEFLALPSEEFQETNLLVADGYYKKSTRIVQKSAKINNEFNTAREFEEEINDEPSNIAIGKKSNQAWSSNIRDLRKKLGFSWQRIARNLVIFLVIFGIAAVVTVTSVAAIAIDYWNTTPSIESLERDPSQNSIVYARDGKTKIYEFFKEEKREVIEDLSEIPLVMQLAVVALEEQNYWDTTNETGIPWRNLAGAMRDCFFSVGGNCRGASGISQQLIKNMTGDDEATTDRKVRELFIAVKLNGSNSKVDILLKYLNWVPFGRNAYGVQEASKAYFGRQINTKDANGNFVLSAPEACYLASMIQRPSYFETGIDKITLANKRKTENRNQPQRVETDGEPVTTNTEEISSNALDLEARKDACLRKLFELDLPLENGESGRYIQTEEELEKLQNLPVVSTTSLAAAQDARNKGMVAFVTLPVDDPYPHFREYITAELSKFMSERQLYEEGYEIVTTLDPTMQGAVDKIIKDNEGLIKSVGGNNASSVVLDGPSGQILAMVGSLGYEREDIDGKVNIATSPQQPGSSIKPYVYAAALDNGFNPATMLNDQKFNYRGYDPKNFDGTFRGPVTIRRALQGSLNIPAVKAMFLVNNEPSTNDASKLVTFFDKSEAYGVRFPCVSGAYNELFPGAVEVCKPNPEAAISEDAVLKWANVGVTIDPKAGITQEMADKAYRGRCFLASSLGGCEVSMVSHATGINTMLQDGNLRTATPFISIKKRSTGEDIYAARQKSSNPVYPFIDADQEKKLLARQMSNIMSDYEARTPEFGNLRFNLELNDKRWRIAAKTGTSNGPRDFWTVGGSPYYTVTLWAGNTDNGVMSPNASAGVSIARVWKEIMENLHGDKDPQNFSTEGLQRYFVRTGGTKPPTTPGQPTPAPSGTTEWLTPKQIEELNQKSGVVALTNPTEYDAAKKKSIFETRTTVIPGSYSINRVDGLLFVEGQTPEVNREIITCNYLLPEFPSTAWQSGVDAFLQKNPQGYCNPPTASSSTAIAGGPSLNINISANAINPTNTIQFSATFPAGSNRTVRELKIIGPNASLSTTSATSSVSLSVPNGGPYNFTFVVVDNLNNEYPQSIANASFNSNQLVGSNIGTVVCTSSPNCLLNYSPASKTFTNVKFQLQGSPTAVNCTASGSGTLNCNGNPISGVSGLPFTLNIDGIVYNLVVS